ncbi:hypothetical protein AB5J62_36360 [Amycolatopsis sp. cg5]|uniref:hypothetical protein n=1 Tax=Amycolatopsis sp. cg5 TaxID=3238802 RepID=UPI003524F7CA
MSGSAQLSSSRFAIVAVVANLVLCTLLGAAWVLIGQTGNTPSAAPEGLSVVETPTPSPVTTSTLPTTTVPSRPFTVPAPSPETAPPAWESISAPAGLTMIIPRGWPTKTVPEPGSMQATDPRDPKRILKFGGAEPADPADIQTYHRNYERQLAQRSGYVLFGLRPTTVRGHEAVDWEFEWNAPEGRRHVRSVYWRAGGIEYYVYAHGPQATWSETAAIAAAMVTGSTP